MSVSATSVYLCLMYTKVLALAFCCMYWVCYGIPPELLEQYSNLNVSNSFIKYDTAAKYPILLPYTQIRAIMPASYSEKAFDIYYRNNQKVLQQNYSCTLEDFALNFLLYYRPVQNVDLKNSKAFFTEEKDRMILQFGNYPVIEEVSSEQAYYEFYLQNGKIHRVKLVVYKGNLVGMIVSGNAPAVHAAPANDFLSSLEIPLTNESNTESLLQPKRDNSNASAKSEVVKSQEEVSTLFILRDSLFAIAFPSKPMRNDFLIKNDMDSYQVVNFFTEKKNKTEQYLVSYRMYSGAILSTEVFFNNAAKVFAQSSKTQVSESRDLDFYKFPAKEFIFKSKKSKYEVRYFAKDNTFIQLVIKAKIKGENKVAAVRFFDSFTL